MLAADRSLLEVNLRQSAIKLREKELNLYSDNFQAMATQAAVLAGFTTTLIIEIHLPENVDFYYKAWLHLCGIISIGSNITCVSLSTITTIWGTGKALRGSDGSMDEAVEGINSERGLIFFTFALGLAGNLLTVMSTCFIIMDYPISMICFIMLLLISWFIYTNAKRIQHKFHLIDTVRLDDLTNYQSKSINNQSIAVRSRKNIIDVV